MTDQQPFVGQSSEPPQQPFVGQSSEPPKLHVHHSYIWLGGIRIVFSIFIAVFAIFVSLLLSDEPLVIDGSAFGTTAIIGVIVLVLFLAIVGVIALMQVLSYRHLYYELGPEEFNLYSGIFNKKRVHIPYQRVQSVNQQATLIQRICGVCTVKIDTAGGSTNKAVTIPYIQKYAAEQLRGELFARKQAILSGQIPGQPNASIGADGQQVIIGPDGQPIQGAGIPYSAGDQHPMAMPGAPLQTGVSGQSNILDLPAGVMSESRGVFGGMAVDTGAVSYEYGMSNKELILTGIFNSTGFIVIVFALVGGIAALAESLMQTAIGEYVVGEGVNIATRAFSGSLVWAALGGTIGLLAIIWIISVIGTSISYGGFRACRRQNRIEVEHGILKHRFHGVDIDRVQSVIIKQSFIKRLFGYCELSLGKIDTAAEGNEEQAKGLPQQGLIVHPFVKMDRIPAILAGLVPEFADVPTEQTVLPKVSLRRALIRRCIIQGGAFWLAICMVLLQVFLTALPGMLDSADRAEISALLPYINTICWAVYVLCLVLLVIEIIGAVMWYRGSSFAYNRKFMQITNGGFSRESVSFPRKKIQFGVVKTNPFQRRSRVATVQARTAAGVGGTTLKLVDVQENDATEWLTWLKPRGNVVK